MKSTETRACQETTTTLSRALRATAKQSDGYRVSLVAVAHAFDNITGSRIAAKTLSRLLRERGIATERRGGRTYVITDSAYTALVKLTSPRSPVRE